MLTVPGGAWESKEAEVERETTKPSFPNVPLHDWSLRYSPARVFHPRDSSVCLTEAYALRDVALPEASRPASRGRPGGLAPAGSGNSSRFNTRAASATVAGRLPGSSAWSGAAVRTTRNATVTCDV